MRASSSQSLEGTQLRTPRASRTSLATGDEGASRTSRTAGMASADRETSAASAGRTSRTSSASRSTRSKERSQARQGSSRRTRRTSASASGDATAVAQKKPFPVKRIVIIAVAVVLVIVALRFFSSVMGVQVTINGNPYTLRGEKTVQTAATECGIPLNPGDLISIRGNVLKRHAGEPFSATVNGKEVTDYNQRLHDGDVVALGDGKDKVEEYESYLRTTDFTAVTSGVGALRKFTRQGSNGSIEVRTGSLSNEVVEKLQAEPVDLVCTNFNVNAGTDKVVALTFEDGPSSDYTAQILDVLAENGAKATFFFIGKQVEEGNNADLVRRAYNEGHLVCSHTYNHANGTGINANLASLSADAQVESVEKGYQVLFDVLNEGREDPDEKVQTGLFAQKPAEPEEIQVSHITRLPGGIADAGVMLNVHDLVDVEVGWTLDTGDWVEPGSDAIVEVLMSVDPGDIVLLHDGGGERYQTVNALREALPQLVKQGYTFVTVADLLEYPTLNS